MLDEYGVFPGEIKADHDDVAHQPSVKIQKFPQACTPAFVVKPHPDDGETGEPQCVASKKKPPRSDGVKGAK